MVGFESKDEKKRILIVDDESSVRESLQMILSRVYEVEIAESGDEALLLFTEQRKEFDLVLLDVMMPGIDGIALLESLRADYPLLPVIMLTASKTVKTAVQAIKLGAVDYLNKPFDVDELLSLVEETLEQGAAGRSSPTRVETHEHSRADVAEVNGDFGSMVGAHPVMTEVYAKVEQLAKRDTTILITGESGTGKELIAREIHRRSQRENAPFVAINCAAIPESLIESELFGHEKGAFTHAVEQRIGHFELADGGTLFLDEIGELSMPVQVKMLRFLQEKEFYRVGCPKPMQVDVRVLAATNRSLETAIKEGQFRQDLFYRINVVNIEMPPLRERREDIAELAGFFVTKLSPLYGGKKPTFSPEALDSLGRYAWPGNVRELENVVESLLALCGEEVISETDLPSRIRGAEVDSNNMQDDVLAGRIPFEEAERAFETEIILKALNKTNFVQTRAAEMLGISRRILKYKMDKLGISEKDSAEEQS